MRHVYKLDGVDCANCALKLEEKIKKIDGVKDASLNFMTLKLTIDFDPSKFDKLKEVCANFEDGVTLKRIG